MVFDKVVVDQLAGIVLSYPALFMGKVLQLGIFVDKAGYIVGDCNGSTPIMYLD